MVGPFSPGYTLAMSNELIIFDADDTLWYTERLYDIARNRAKRLVATTKIDTYFWDVLQRQIDAENVKKYGFDPGRFPTSSVEAYERAAIEENVEYDHVLAAQIYAASATVFSEIAPLIPGVEAVLEDLSQTYRLVLLTQGDIEVQEKRIFDSGLANFFEKYWIVERKNVRTFEAITGWAGVDPEDAWSVGNSIPSDINPALRAGLNAIIIETRTWTYESRESLVMDSGNFFFGKTLKDVRIVIEGWRNAQRNLSM